DALVAAATPPGGPATLIIPQDTCWTDVDDVPSPVAEVPPRALTSPTEIDAVAAALREAGRSAVVVLGTTGLRGDALIAASRVAAATGCRVMTQGMSGRYERGAGIPSFGGVPYFPEQAVEALADATLMVLAGSTD